MSLPQPGHSPYATRDPQRHAAELARVDPEEVHEFYGPFAMVDDLVELVHIVSPSHGEIDAALLLDPKPVQVYVNSEAGRTFLEERFPNARRFQVPAADLYLAPIDGGRGLVCDLRSDQGPFRELSLVVRALPGARPVAERYEAMGVWGSTGLSCHGIDLRVAARARGRIVWGGGATEAVDRRAVLFRGSYGKIQPIR